MQSKNFTRLLPWILMSALLMVAAVVTQRIAPGDLVAVSLYKAHLLSMGGWMGYWLDRGLFPYDRPHEYLLPEDDQPEGEDVAQAELVSGHDYGMAMLRRAVVVAACLICVGLGA